MPPANEPEASVRQEPGGSSGRSYRLAAVRRAGRLVGDAPLLEQTSENAPLSALR